MSKGFVPAHSFQSGSQAMAKDPGKLIDQCCFTRNEKATRVESTHLSGIPLTGIDAIRQALIDRRKAQRIERERFARLHKQ